MPESKKSFCLDEDVFYPRVSSLLKKSTPKQHALVSLDFDNFNFINDLFGFIVGDKVLTRIEEIFNEGLNEGEFFVRAHADHFIFFVEIDSDRNVASRFEEIAACGRISGTILPEHYVLVCSAGIVIIDDPTERLTILLDKANFARKKAKGNHCNTFLYYDLDVCEELEWKKKITLSMQSGLQNGEFEMYLQPKISLMTGEIVGAEALARWNSRAYGMIYPNHFIPVFEQNGFVKVLDFFMLREACKFLKRCEKEGLALFPISVNFSKLHIQTPNLAQRIFKVVRDCEVSSKYIEIELTESVVSQNFQLLISTVTQLKQLGFTVSLDDFGSAYSSLNHLKELPLDIIKIDRVFLNSLSGNSKSIPVLKKMLELAKDLHMNSVIEGVETLEQVELMKGLGCDIAQGYFYAKPLDESRFISFLENHGPQGLPKATAAHRLNSELKTQQTLWDIHTILDEADVGIIRAYIDKSACIQFINRAALNIFNLTRTELRTLYNDDTLLLISPKSRAIMLRHTAQLAKNHITREFQISINHKDKTESTISGRVTYTEDENNRPMAVYAFVDVNERLKESGFLRQTLSQKISDLEAELEIAREQNAELKQQTYRSNIVQELSDLITFEWSFESDTINISENYEKIMGRKAICRDFSTNAELLMRFHPDDRALFRHWTEATFKKRGTTSAELRLSTADGRYIWLRVGAKVLCDENNIPIKAYGFFANIDRQKSELALLKQKSQYDPLTHLYSKEELNQRIANEIKNHPDKNSALLIIDVDNLSAVNENLGHQFGDNVLKELASEITRLFDHDCIAGRFGGDEFAIFVHSDAAADKVAERAKELLAQTRKTYLGENTSYCVSCSIGAALYPQHAKTHAELFRISETALFNAKIAGKDCFKVYSPDMIYDKHASLTPLDLKSSFLDTYFTGDTIYNVFELLYETKDLKTTIHKILELVGQSLHVDRAYIFEYTSDKKHLSNTFEWCAPLISPEIDNLRHVPIEMYSVFPARFNGDGMHICDDIQDLDEVSYNILNRQNIKSVLQSALHTDGELTGFVGFDDCHSKHTWRGEEIATLGYISRILSVFLKKNSVTKELSKSYENYEQMIYNLNGYVYVINPSTFELLYINKPMEDLGISIGEKCYTAAFGTNSPCENCPARKLTKETPRANEDIFSTKINCWVNSAASLLKWTDGHDAALVCCTAIKSSH